MADKPSIATVYVKKGCPFCLKLRIFLLEANVLGQIKLREFAEGTQEELEIRTELAPHFEKVSFPTIKLSSGVYLSDSDAIITRLAGLRNSDFHYAPFLVVRAAGRRLKPDIRYAAISD